MLRTIVILALFSASLSAQPVAVCDPIPGDPSVLVGVTCQAPDVPGTYHPFVEITVPEPPPPGETDFLALPGAVCYDFNPGALGVPTVATGCTGGCVLDIFGDVTHDPAVGVNGGVRFGPGGGYLQALFAKGSQPPTRPFEGFDDGGPVTMIGFASREGNFTNSRLFDFMGNFAQCPGANGIMLSMTGGYPYKALQAYSGNDHDGGCSGFPVRRSVDGAVPDNRPFCHAVSWSPGEHFKLYLDGAEVAYDPQFDVVLDDRASGPMFGKATIGKEPAQQHVGWQDRLCKFQVQLTDAQHAEFCSQGGW